MRCNQELFIKQLLSFILKKMYNLKIKIIMIKKIKIIMIKKYFSILIVLASLLTTTSALAACNEVTGEGCDKGVAGAGADKSGNVELPNPLGNIKTPQALIGQVINGALGIVGSLALIMFVYGGFQWLISAGDPKKIQTGKDILFYATLGLVIIFSSYAMVKFVITSIGG